MTSRTSLGRKFEVEGWAQGVRVLCPHCGEARSYGFVPEDVSEDRRLQRRALTGFVAWAREDASAYHVCR